MKSSVGVEFDLEMRGKGAIQRQLSGSALGPSQIALEEQGLEGVRNLGFREGCADAPMKSIAEGEIVA